MKYKDKQFIVKANKKKNNPIFLTYFYTIRIYPKYRLYIIKNKLF